MGNASARYQQLFHDFNDRYFAGRLPDYRVRVVRQMSCQHQGSLHHFDGECRRRERAITLAGQTVLGGARLTHTEEDMRQILIHEMAHAATNDYHGLKWRGEMRRLAQLGAPVQADDLGKPMTPSQKWLESAFDDTLTNSDDYATLTLRQALVRIGLVDDAPRRLRIAQRKFFRGSGSAASLAILKAQYPWLSRLFRDCREGYIRQMQQIERTRAQKLRSKR